MDLRQEKQALSHSGRVLYLDVLRCAAIFAVVVIHVSCDYDSHAGVSAYAGALFNSLSRWCVPVFVMISGALFLQPDKTVSIRQLFFKYILRLAVVYLVWVLLYSFALYPLYRAIWLFVKGQPVCYVSFTRPECYFHLWFLPMLMGVYITIPVCQAIIKHGVAGYFLLVWAFFNLVLFDGLYVPKFLHIPHVFAGLIRPEMMTGYCGYFLLGAYLSQRVPTRREAIMAGSAAVIAMLITLAGKLVQGKVFHEYLSPNVILMSAGVFVATQYFISVRGTEHKVLERFTRAVRPDVFGIYLIHLFFIYLLNRGLLLPHNGWVWVAIPGVSLLVFMLSWLCAKVLRRIPYVGYFCG